MQYRSKAFWGWGLSALLGACSFEGSVEDPVGGPASLAASSGTTSADLLAWDAGSPSLIAPPPPAASIDPDGDGLSSAYEAVHGTDPNLADTDLDGVGDLVEFVAASDARDPQSSPLARGDFYFLSAFDAAPSPERETLRFATALRSADLFILADTTGSMQPVIDVLRERLASRIVPEASRAIADLRVGVGTFQDLPVAPYGDPGDVMFKVMQTPTEDTALAQVAVNALKLGSGGDGPEAAIPALYALATGEGLGAWVQRSASCWHGGLGYACFRPSAVPIVLLISDAEFHNGPDAANPYLNLDPMPASYAVTSAALRAIHAHVISIHVASAASLAAVSGAIAPGAAGTAPVAPAVSAANSAADQMRALSRDTGAVDAAGQPLFFAVDADATGLDARVVDAVKAVADQVPITVSAVLRDDPSDDVDATKLIERVEPHTSAAAGDASGCAAGLATRDRDGDGVADAFRGVRPGTPVCFDVLPRRNTLVRSGNAPRVYRAFIDVIGDDITTLDTRTVYFLLPPASPVLL